MVVVVAAAVAVLVVYGDLEFDYLDWKAMVE